MKLFVSVFLHVLGSFSLIKTVHSLSCYATNLGGVEASMVECQSRIMGEISKDDSEDEMASKVFGCIRKAMNKEQLATCDSQHPDCTTVIYELKDHTELMIKGCGKSGSGECDVFKSKFAFAGDFVKPPHCDYCSSNNCNNQKPKSDPHLSSAVSAPPAAAVLITVLITHILL